MAKKQVMLTFSEPVIREPVIYTLSQEFRLITNIVRADLAENSGWIIVELIGTKEDIEQGFSWIISKGIRIDPVAE